MESDLATLSSEAIAALQKNAFLCAQRKDFAQELADSEILLAHFPFQQELIARFCFLLHLAGRTEESTRYESRLVKKYMLYNCQAEHYFEQHAYHKAFSYFAQSWRTKQDVLTVCRLVACLYRLGKKKWAFDGLTHCLKKWPDNPYLWVELGLFWMGERDFEKSKKCIFHAIACDPGLFIARYNAALVLNHLNAYPEAMDQIHAALAIQPESAELYNVMGNTYKGLGDLDQAVEAYHRSLAYNPQHADAWGNLAACWERRNQWDQANYCYEQALHHNPHSHEIRSNYALCVLRQGQWKTGWDLYESRKYLPYHEIGIKRYPFPHWEGEDLQGKTIWLWSEQGIGDHIMPLFLIRELDNQYTDLTVVVQADKRLFALIQRSFVMRPGNRLEVGYTGDRQPDYQSSFWSLFRFFRHTEGQFAQAAPYLQADLRLWEPFWAARPKRRTMAIAWHTRNALHAPYRNCPLPAWQEFLAHFANWDIFSVQYGDHQAEIQRYNQTAVSPILTVPDLDLMHDLDGLAGFLAHMDAVLTIDNLTIHLAGALGVPTWGLLPFHADWRWCHDQRSRWYPQVHLVRQKTSGDWPGVFAQLQRDPRLMDLIPYTGV